MTPGRIVAAAALLVTGATVMAAPSADLHFTDLQAAVQAQAAPRPRPTIDTAVFRELQWHPIGDPAASMDMLSVVTDTAFPFRVCGTERHAGPLCISSAPETTAAGTSTFPVSPVVVERGTTIRPDPNDPEVIYGGNLTRYDRRIDQIVPISPPGEPGFQALPSAPILFSPDNKTLYYGANKLWRSATGGQSWTVASPELTSGGPGAAISALEFSPIAPRTFWAGTSDGRLHVSRDAGVSWTPAPLPGAAGGSILSIEASHFDPGSAYVITSANGDAAAVAAVGVARSLWRTRDDGATWTRLSGGLPDSGPWVVREDTLRRGLLFAGTDVAVFVSFDDGDTWQELRLNMPRVVVRDLALRGADIVVATGGHGFWMLPDISALRQVTPDVLRAPAFLVRPGAAWRMRSTVSSGASDGIAFHYVIGAEPPPVLTLEILITATGEVLRRFSSDAPEGSADWIDRSPGLHRKTWDLRHAAPPVVGAAGSSASRATRGVPVLPGIYQVRLTAGTRPLRQAISISLDPRVRVSIADLTAQYALARAVDAAQRKVATALAPAIGAAAGATAGAAAGTAADPSKRSALEGAGADLAAVARTLQQFDGRPTASVEAAASAAIARADAAVAR